MKPDESCPQLSRPWGPRFPTTTAASYSPGTAGSTAPAHQPRRHHDRVRHRPVPGQNHLTGVVRRGVRGAGSLPAASCLPGGRTFAALAAGTTRVAEAVDGESVVVDVIATDLLTFAGVVGTAEQDAARSLSGTAGAR
ncbi:MAG: hypothetical protein L0J31_02450 [Corynebacterium sp.]|nr:hypothetical protein [Corynebacterium sp.]